MSTNAPSIVKRQARAIRILTCLQSGPHFNARELARRLKVSRRTIYRDLNLIREAGIPVQFDNEHSAYRLTTDSPDTLTPPDLDLDDLTRIVLTSHLSVLNGFSDYAMSVRESVARLLGNYSQDVRKPISRLLSCCEVSIPKPEYSGQMLTNLEQIFYAIGQRRKIRIVVDCGAQNTVQTSLSPYKIVVSLDDWAVVGRSSLHRCTQTFSIRAIQSLRMTAESYKIPRGFRSRQRWTRGGTVQPQSVQKTKKTPTPSSATPPSRNPNIFRPLSGFRSA